MGTPGSSILSRIANGETAGSNPDELSPSPGVAKLTAIAAGPDNLTFEREGPKDIGVVGAFSQGVKSGVVAPLKILGVEPELDPIFGESEKVSQFLGSFVGLGISFIPFNIGAGMALRGIGLTAEIPEIIAGVETGKKVVNPLYSFAKNVIGGSVQGAGISEEASDIPQNLAIGAAIGAGVEGFFLAKAMRGRAGAVLEGGAITGERAQQEIAIALTESKPAQASAEVIEALKEEPTFAVLHPEEPVFEIKNGKPVKVESKVDLETYGPISDISQDELTYSKVLASLTQTQSETVRVAGIKSPADFISKTKKLLPNAQVISRPNAGLFEILIHNPTDPFLRLSGEQQAQWMATGFARNMEVNYTNAAGTKAYRVTGGIVKEGLIQLQDPLHPGIIFAPKIEQVTKLAMPRFYGELSSRETIFKETLEATKNKVGYAIESEPGVAKIGTVDTSAYTTVKSESSFWNTNRDAVLGYQAASLEEARSLFLKARGIKGLIVEENGIQSKIIPFDKSTISAVKDVHSFGYDLDQAVLGEDGIQSFIPSWKNSIIGALKEKDIPEKDLRSYLDLYEKQLGKRLKDIPDGEFKSMVNQFQAQWTEGCL